MNLLSLPPVADIGSYPIRVLLASSSFGLEALRRTLIAQHRDAFEQPELDSFDPSNWMARTLGDQIVALLQTIDLYQHAVLCADAASEDF